METEKLQIYDEQGTPQSIADRQTVHKKGYWHETFHCWVAGQQGGRYVVYLQLRSNEKKDFPGLFDIAAAGHLLAGETVEEGIREVREELGIRVDFAELISIGMIKDQLALPGFLDNERCHCFLYTNLENMDLRFELQLEEVVGIGKLDFEAFADLVSGKKERAVIEGFEILKGGSKRCFKKVIGLEDLVPHSAVYFDKIVELIGQELNK